jgi:hypothetical protein
MDQYSGDLFEAGKYRKCYFFMIARARQAGRIKARRSSPRYQAYYEAHHIVPRCMGGSNCLDNIALLTAKEHYICHWLLTKMCKMPAHRNKMLYAFNRLYSGECRSVNQLAALYSESKAAVSAAISASHKHRTVKDETRKKLSEINLGKKKSDEHRAKITNAVKGCRYLMVNGKRTRFPGIS